MNKFWQALFILPWAVPELIGAQPWSSLGSLAIIMSIPVVVIFLIFQRTLLDRMMFGSINE